MNKQFALLSIATVAIFSVFLPHSYIFADSYGTNTTPNDLTVNKLVRNPITNVYVENLGSNGPTFSPGSTITYRLLVKNNSGETMNTKLEDTLPSYLSYESSSVPAYYDAGNRKITMDLGAIIAGQNREIEVRAKVAPVASFPKDRTMFCVSNYAKVTSPARPNGTDDSAESCITTGGAPTLPVAGVNDLFALLPFVTLGGIGTILLKKKN